MFHIGVYVPHGCVTGCRLHNWTPSCTTDYPNVLPESLPILGLLLNWVDSPIRLNDSHHIACFCKCVHTSVVLVNQN